jgi:hypothetical protein
MIRYHDQESLTFQVITSSMRATIAVLVAYSIMGFTLTQKTDVEDLLTDPRETA